MKDLKLTNLTENELKDSELANTKGGVGFPKGIDDFILTGMWDPNPGNDPGNDFPF